MRMLQRTVRTELLCTHCCVLLIAHMQSLFGVCIVSAQGSTSQWAANSQLPNPGRAGVHFTPRSRRCRQCAWGAPANPSTPTKCCTLAASGGRGLCTWPGPCQRGSPCSSDEGVGHGQSASSPSWTPSWTPSRTKATARPRILTCQASVWFEPRVEAFGALTVCRSTCACCCSAPPACRFTHSKQASPTGTSAPALVRRHGVNPSGGGAAP